MTCEFVQNYCSVFLGSIKYFYIHRRRDRVMKFLELLILVCLASFTFADVIVDEGFEGGVLPTGWQIWEFGDTGAIEWEVILEGTGSYPSPDTAHTGEYYVYHDDGILSDPASDSWLVTDTYDLSTYSTVNVIFWREIGWPLYYSYTGFCYSTVESPASTDFTELFELGNSNGYEWWEFSNDFSTECAGQSYVTFAWVYLGGFMHSDAIDDFLLEAFGTALDRDTWGAIKSTF
jgi:hypothetical protein